jgi:hypothetical protein
MSSDSLYRSVVRNAIAICWKHKHLWVFGFFAVILGVGGVVESVLSISVKGLLFVAGIAGDAIITYPGQETINAVLSTSQHPTLMAVLFAVGGAALTLAYLWMSGVSASALVHAGLAVPKGGDVHFSEGLRVGSLHAWKVVGTSALAKLVTFALAAGVSVALWQLLKNPSFVAAGFFVVGLIVLGGLAIAFNAFATFTVMAIVARNERLGVAARSAALALEGRWLLAVEAGFLTFVMALGIGVLGIAAAAIILMPIAVIYLLAALANMTGLLVVLVLISAVVIVGVIVYTGSLIATFQAVAWTLLWSRMAENRAVAKVHRVWDGIKERFI